MEDCFSNYMKRQMDGTFILPNWKCFYSIFFKSLSASELKQSGHMKLCGETLYPLDHNGDPIYNMGREFKDLEILYSFYTVYYRRYVDFMGCTDLELVADAAEAKLHKWKRLQVWENISRNRESKSDHKNSLEMKRAYDWKDFYHKPRKRESLWKDFWYEQEICCLFADANVGKSVCAVQIASKIAEREIKVLYCDCEMDEEQFIARYSHSNGSMYSFPSEFYRSQPKPEVFARREVHEAILDDIEFKVKEEGFKVVIVDNLSFITPSSNSGSALTRLMYRLKRLRKKYMVSFLIIAHTVKRDRRLPIEPNDLQGHKRLFDFVDSCFAIGRSTKDKDLLYFKQLKCREAAFSHGADNVLLAKLERQPFGLFFNFLGCANEQDLLPPRWNSDAEWLCGKVLELREEKMSEKQIADRLGISKSKVHRILISNSEEERPEEN